MIREINGNYINVDHVVRIASFGDGVRVYLTGGYTVDVPSPTTTEQVIAVLFPKPKTTRQAKSAK